jgi:hypothetical protein
MSIKTGSLFELSSNDVREDLHFPMRVKSKAIVSLDTVFVDDSQPSERLETISKILPVRPNSVKTQFFSLQHLRRYGKCIQRFKPVSWTSTSAFRVLSKFKFGHLGCWIVDSKLPVFYIRHIVNA